MVGTLSLGALIVVCCVLLPLSGWWLAARLRDDSLLRFTAASLAGVTALAVAELFVRVGLPQQLELLIVAAKDAQGRRIPLYRVFVASLCTDLLPGSFCRSLIPPQRASTCLGVTVESNKVMQTGEPCVGGYLFTTPFFL